MSDGLREQIGAYQHRLEHLLRDGLDLHRQLTADPRHTRTLEIMGVWQRECAATISQLSGGSKAHWLSRAYSEAFLLWPSGPSEAVAEAAVSTIVERIVNVLREAQTSLASMGQDAPSPGTAAPATARFGFVHDVNLRPRLEQAFADAEAARAGGDYPLALLTAASVLEAIITDALEHLIGEDRDGEGASRSVAEWTFAARIEAAERARLISAGCARLPRVARQYRELIDEAGELDPKIAVSEQEAKVTSQVLRLIMRDLAPSR